MRYLITGGAGFIGSHLADALVSRGHHVLVVDDLSTGRLDNLGQLLDSDAIVFVEGSVLDPHVVDRCVRSTDACFHLASAVGVQLITRRPLESLLTNVRGTDIVISAAARNRKRLLFTSSSEIYGKHGAGPLDENSDRILGSPFKSRWSYATAKAFGEALAHSYFAEKGAETIVVRLFNTVGPRQTDLHGMVLPRFVKQALTGEPLTVYGNGTQSRCFVHVLDVVHVLVQLMGTDAAIGNAYNVGGRTSVPIIELARRVIEISRSDSKVQLVPYEEAYDSGFEELGRREPDTSAVEELTGWRPARTLDETIEDVLAYERERLEEERRSSEARTIRVAG